MFIIFVYPWFLYVSLGDPPGLQKPPWHGTKKSCRKICAATPSVRKRWPARGLRLSLPVLRRSAQATVNDEWGKSKTCIWTRLHVGIHNLTINVRMVLVKFMRIIWGVYDQYGKPIDIINYYGDYVGMVNKGQTVPHSDYRFFQGWSNHPQVITINGCHVYHPKWYPLVI